MDNATQGLGALLRLWRDRLSPADAGLPVGSGRRATGLRREELAALAGLSVDYVVRLEQGRATHPSPQVVSAVARALQLDRTERDHLYRSAGLLPPSDGRVSSHIPPSVQRLVARMAENPLAVFTADWSLVSWNPMWSALHGDPGVVWPEPRNLVRATFGDPSLRSHQLPTVSKNGPDSLARALVADLRTALAVYPDDPALARLVAELRSTSAHFAELWATGAVGRHDTDRKTISHPQVGDIVLDCDVLTVPGADLRLVLLSAAGGTPDAEKLDFLRVRAVANLDVGGGLAPETDEARTS